MGARAPRGALCPRGPRCLRLSFASAPLLQPEAGLRKGSAAAKRSRSRSAPPATGQGLPRWPAAAVALPRLRWRVVTMEEMVIWEQHTVTLSKVSAAQGGQGRGWGLWDRLCLTPLCPSPLGPSTRLWLRCLWRPGPSQQDDRGHSGGRFGCGVWGTGSGPAPVSAWGRGRCSLPAGTGRAVNRSCWDRASTAATLPGWDGVPLGQWVLSLPHQLPRLGAAPGAEPRLRFPSQEEGSHCDGERPFHGERLVLLRHPDT